MVETYDFSASAFFSVQAESLEEAYEKAEKWAEENMSVVRGYDVDVEFIKIYKEA